MEKDRSPSTLGTKDSRTITLVAATDEAYALPLAVMIRSALENLAKGWHVDLFVLTDNVTESTKAKIKASWAEFSINTTWIHPDVTDVESAVSRAGYAGVPATYFRLMIGALLPQEVHRAIYLDCDMIVNDDISLLWDMPFDDAIILAVPDAYRRKFHTKRLAEVNLSPLPAFAPDDDYFNAGVLVIDLPAWRNFMVGERAIEVAKKHKADLASRDQDALNIVLRSRWARLHPTWNFHELPQNLSAWQSEGRRADDLMALFRAPKIVHFATGDKPWKAVCFHSTHQPVFLDVLTRTQFSDYEVPKLRGVAALYQVLIGSCITVNWHLWRGLFHTRDPEILRQLLGFIVRRPWVVPVYPLWAIYTTLRDGVRHLRGGR